MGTAHEILTNSLPRLAGDSGAAGVSACVTWRPTPSVPRVVLTPRYEATVAMIRNPKISNAELMTLMPGPDFPGGGQL